MNELISNSARSEIAATQFLVGVVVGEPPRGNTRKSKSSPAVLTMYPLCRRSRYTMYLISKSRRSDAAKVMSLRSGTVFPLETTSKRDASTK